MKNDSRRYTKYAIQLVDDGGLDCDKVLLACLKYMSESEVEDMLRVNDFLEYVEEESCESCAHWTFTERVKHGNLEVVVGSCEFRDELTDHDFDCDDYTRKESNHVD